MNYISIEDRIDRLRVLSEAKPPEHYERLKKIQQHTRMIGQIFGIYGVVDEKTEEKQEERALKEMSFEEKRKLLQAQFPNKVSAEQRAKAREALNFIANNPELFNYHGSHRNPIIHDSDNILTSRSWPSTTASEDALTAPRNNIKTMESSSSTAGKIRFKPATEVHSRFNGTWKFGNYDNFAKVIPPDSDESVDTVYDGIITPVQFDPELITPLHTCTQ